jgi:hypothetical protein
MNRLARWGSGESMHRVRRIACIAALAVLVLPAWLAAQTDGQTLASQNLRAYWHVFVAYVIAWGLVLGWLVSVARRLARVERSLDE